jgi:hypothetical protein
MTTVTLVTSADRRADNLSEQDYRDIYAELRERRSLADFIAFTQSVVSRAWWSQYEARAKQLDWQRKNELRRAVGLPDLAPSVGATLLQVSADATVWRVGEGAADTVIFVTPELPSGALLSVNGEVHIARPVATADGAEADVTPVTPASRARRVSAAIGGLRIETRAAHDARRRAAGLTWDAYLSALLDDSQPYTGA